jgi:hypothetical protein
MAGWMALSDEIVIDEIGWNEKIGRS